MEFNEYQEKAHRIAAGLASFENALKEKKDSLSLEDKYNQLVEDYGKLARLYSLEVSQHNLPKSYQDQYAAILKKLIDNPKKIGNSRIGMINSKFVETMRIDLTKEFPLQDIKYIKFSNIVHELLWMIKGDTNVKYLIENECTIWTDDAYRYYLEKYAKYEVGEPVDKDTFIEKTLNDEVINYGIGFVYKYGNLDKIYGKQWRKFGILSTDQLQNCIDTLIKNPDDRRMIVTGHNPSDIESNDVGLPSCHNYFQFYSNPDVDGRRKLSTFVNIRSNDFFLGNPYNVAQYALLTHIVANIVDMDVDELYLNIVDCHLYHEHFDPANIWLDRFSETRNDNYCTAKLQINKKLTSIDDINASDFEVTDYNPQPYIKAKLLT